MKGGRARGKRKVMTLHWMQDSWRAPRPHQRPVLRERSRARACMRAARHSEQRKWDSVRTKQGGGKKSPANRNEPTRNAQMMAHQWESMPRPLRC
eukprot:2942324-Rhodomonas_salina.1